MRKLLSNLKISKIIYAVILFCNLVLPLQGEFMKLDVLQLIAVIIWTYALLSQLGYFRTQISDGSDGVIRFEPNTPIIQICLLRAIQFGYLFMIKKEIVNWKVFIIVFVLDMFYLVFLLFDKSRYVFEMEGEDENI